MVIVFQYLKLTIKHHRESYLFIYQISIMLITCQVLFKTLEILYHMSKRMSHVVTMAILMIN